MTQHTTLCLVLGAILLFSLPVSANAAEDQMRITVTLVSCGETKADIPKACKADSRCCAFLPSAETAANVTPAPQVFDLALDGSGYSLMDDVNLPDELYTDE